jgi:hypothetical protein
MKEEMTVFASRHRSMLVGLLLLFLLLWNHAAGDSTLRPFPQLRNMEAVVPQQNTASVVSCALNARLYKQLGHCVDCSRRKLFEPAELPDDRRVLKRCARLETCARYHGGALLIFDKTAPVVRFSNSIPMHASLARIHVCHPKGAPPTIC